MANRLLRPFRNRSRSQNLEQISKIQSTAKSRSKHRINLDYVDSDVNVFNFSTGMQNNITTSATSLSQVRADKMTDAVELNSVSTADGDQIAYTLHEAARNGSKEDLEYLIKQDAENRDSKKKYNLVDKLDEYMAAPIHYAVRYNHNHCIEKLLDCGATVNIKGEDGATPLHYAAKFCKPKKTDDQTIQVQGNINSASANEDQTDAGSDDLEGSSILLLIQNNASINLPDNYGLTPMHYAAVRGNQYAVQCLLSVEGCQHEIPDKQLMTPLHMSTSNGRLEVTITLLERGVNILCRDDEEATPLHGACMEGHLDIVKALVNYAKTGRHGYYELKDVLNATDTDNCTPLHYATENSHASVVAFLLENGADVNAKKSNGKTSLHLAAVRSLEIVKLLLRYGAKVNVKNTKSQTPLHRAAGFNRPQIVEYLIQKGARIEARDCDFFTPLLSAAAYGRVDSVKTLLEKNVDITATDYKERSAVYWAAQENQPETLQLLLSRDPRKTKVLVDAADTNDNYPLHVASREGYVNCVKILLEHGAQIDARNEEELTPLHLAADNGRTQVVRVLVNYDSSIVNDEDESSNSPLHIAAIKGHVHVISALLEYGAAVDAKNATGWTPLDCAAANGWPKTIEILLDGDSPVDPMDKRKTTPLHLAAQNGHKVCVKLLLQNGADITLTDETGRNCLDMAIEEGHRDVAVAIIRYDKWEEALKNTTVSPTGDVDTPLRKLIRKLPDVAELVFNKCTIPNNEPIESLNYKVHLRYDFLDDVYTDWFESNPQDKTDEILYEYKIEDNTKKYKKRITGASFKRNHPLMIMVNSQRQSLLAHPLVNCFLRYKWERSGRYIYYTNLLIYLIYLFFLTGFTIYNQYGINATCNLKPQASLATQGTFSYIFFVGIGSVIVTVLSAVRLAIELFQVFYQRFEYFTLENLLEVTGFIMSLLFTAGAIQLRFYWRLQFGAVAIFLAWFNLILFIRKFPIIGIYVVMFIDIFNTFVKFFVIFMLFITAFGLAFFVLLQNHIPFNTPGKALIKTAVMTIGEFDFDDTFNSPGLLVCFQAVTYILFGLFIIFMPILLMNLLIGLAVDDIKEVQQQAVLKRLAMQVIALVLIALLNCIKSEFARMSNSQRHVVQVSLVLDVEQFMPNWIREKFSIKEQVFYPNNGNKLLRKFSFLQSVSPLSQITLKAEKSPTELLENQQNNLRLEVKDLRTQVESMQAQNERLLTLVGALVQHHNVAVDEEDDVGARFKVRT
ncbi:Transient receptor potential cation channel subfamily A member 1-like protein [Trichoplax sp. H2]|nr:Transient receptor potential cation channel subfamily A member 1-like protein [Trichoplax sp. H2]|eukprot:RDD37563.1 Transient receptor potential cation channel subfamily A member 1-like protein [Trichoplax sp. H2]